MLPVRRALTTSRLPLTEGVETLRSLADGVEAAAMAQDTLGAISMAVVLDMVTEGTEGTEVTEEVAMAVVVAAEVEEEEMEGVVVVDVASQVISCQVPLKLLYIRSESSM